MSGTADNRIARVGRRVLLGGSFDPPTRAHVRLIGELSARFDEVIVCPARHSPFKNGHRANGEMRLAMLQDCTKDTANVTVTDFELNATGVSYSFRTAMHFFEGAEPLYFAIGTDMLPRLHEWMRPDILRETVVFYVIPRPGYPAEDEYAAKLFRLQPADFSGENGSSTAFRVAHAFGRGGEVSPASVVALAEREGLYRDWFYITSRYGDYNLSERRIAHTYRVAMTALALAERFDADQSRCIRAALFHDIGKHTPPSTVLDEEATAELERLPKPVRHAAVSRAIATRDFDETDGVVLDAIGNHTVGRADMTLIEKIVFVADYIEPGRDFAGLEPIRAAAAHDLNRAVYLVYENTVGYLTAHNLPVEPKTFDAMAHYKVSCK